MDALRLAPAAPPSDCISRTTGVMPQIFLSCNVAQASANSPIGDDGVIVLTIAASMSGTHEAAAIAAGQLGDRVRVVDSATAAGAGC